MEECKWNPDKKTDSSKLATTVARPKDRADLGHRNAGDTG